MTPKRLTERLEAALKLRDRLFPEPWYRWVHGEGDGLSGLVIDRFDDVVVVRVSTAGMETMKDAIVRAIQRLLHPRGIILKNDGRVRSVEGLPTYIEQVQGTPIDVLPVRENGVRFEVPLSGGQKAGWFYGHRMSRARLQHYSPGCRVLDVFSHIGDWGLQAAAGGADAVTCIDSSGQALASVRENAARNGFGQVETMEGDAFDLLRELAHDKQKFDIVVLDHPAFISRRRDQKTGEQAYARLNQLGLRLLERDGLLVSASCSMHLPADRLVDIIRRSARKVDRFVQLLEQGREGPDYPVVPGIPETGYLKASFVRSLTEFL